MSAPGTGAAGNLLRHLEELKAHLRDAHDASWAIYIAPESRLSTLRGAVAGELGRLDYLTGPDTSPLSQVLGAHAAAVEILDRASLLGSRMQPGADRLGKQAVELRDLVNDARAALRLDGAS